MKAIEAAQDMDRAGYRRVTLAQMDAEFRALGYRLDRSWDCKGLATYMTGPYAGQSYPHCSLHVVECDTGVSYAHYRDARRDDNFRKMMSLRSEIYSLYRERIYTV